MQKNKFHLIIVINETPSILCSWCKCLQLVPPNSCKFIGFFQISQTHQPLPVYSLNVQHVLSGTRTDWWLFSSIEVHLQLMFANLLRSFVRATIFVALLCIVEPIYQIDPSSFFTPIVTCDLANHMHSFLLQTWLLDFMLKSIYIIIHLLSLS